MLRTKSQEPYFVEHRLLLHKIGVTGGEVEKRIGKAALDPTYLMADVEILATYKLKNIDRVKLENLLHRVFAPAQLNIDIKDRFGNPVKPREWFLVPLPVIDEAVRRVNDKSIVGYEYDLRTASLVRTV